MLLQGRSLVHQLGNASGAAVTPLDLILWALAASAALVPLGLASAIAYGMILSVHRSVAKKNGVRRVL